MSSPRPRFAPEASADIRRIVRYSKKAWGDRQASIYRATLGDAFTRITAWPGIGGSLPDTTRDVRRLTVEQHYIYYLIDEAGVLILRVMHVRMDEPDLQLSPSRM